MLVCIPQVLDAAQIVSLRERLDRANCWVDGRVTAGYQGAPVKFNQQIDERSDVALACQRIIVPALESTPLFNRYGEGMTFGAHVDGSVRLHPRDGRKLRTDISATLFLSNPDEYDGGELLIEDTFGRHSVKLPAGDMVIYPATGLHQVAPITRGVRVGCFFWVQSLIRGDVQRTLLYDMDGAIQRLNQTDADDVARRTLIGCYHNLVRQWSET